MKIVKYMLLALTFVFCTSAFAGGKAKTTICHKPDKNGGTTISMSGNVKHPSNLQRA